MSELTSVMYVMVGQRTNMYRISSKSRRTVLTLNALNAALEFSPHVLKRRHYYCERVHILTLILNNAQCTRSPSSVTMAALEMSLRQTRPRN